MGYKPGTVPPYPGYIGGGASRGYSRSGAAEAAPAGSFLVTSEAQGDGTGLCCYDAAYSTLLDAPGGSAASDGGAVGSISDVSGNEGPCVQSTVGARPTLDMDGFGGGPCLTFDGGDYLMLDGFAGGADTQPTTIVAIFSLADITNQQRIMGGGTDGSNQRNEIYITATEWMLYAGAGSNSGISPTTSPTCIVGYIDGASSFLVANGVTGATDNAGASHNMNGVCIGGGGGGAVLVRNGAKIAAVAVYDGDIGADARAYIWSQAQARWGLT